ncbi:MAG TPA: GNAT family N-acetyltransferase [Patescibacteria group bacterium]|nr:GNAT family N-acetyltransferase [Patescibacteria group bacterium]
MVNDIVIRPARIKDARRISTAFRLAYTPLFIDQKLSSETIEDMYRDNNVKNIEERLRGNYFFIAEEASDGGLVGVIGLRKNDGSNKHDRISTFFVLENYRGKGVGSKLFEKVMEIVNQLGVQKLFVNSSLFAEKIYAKWGFRRVDLKAKKYPNGDIYKKMFGWN